MNYPARARIPDNTIVQMGGRELIFGQHIVELRDANDIREDPDALRDRLREDGYLLIRGFHDAAAVGPVRLEILREIEKQGGLAKDKPVEEAVVSENGGRLPDNGRIGIGDDRLREMSLFMALVNAESTLQFFDSLLGGPTRTYTHKWVRIYEPGQSTEIHYDSPYMGRDGSEGVVTTWTAIGDITLDMGPLAIALGSHRLDDLIATYGQINALGGSGHPGYLTTDPFEVLEKYDVKWATTRYEPGDMLMFGKYFLHGSLENVSNRFRLSTDTRFQLAADPVDKEYKFEARA